MIEASVKRFVLLLAVFVLCQERYRQKKKERFCMKKNINKLFRIGCWLPEKGDLSEEGPAKQIPEHSDLSGPRPENDENLNILQIV